MNDGIAIDTHTPRRSVRVLDLHFNRDFIASSSSPSIRCRSPRGRRRPGARPPRCSPRRPAGPSPAQRRRALLRVRRCAAWDRHATSSTTLAHERGDHDLYVPASHVFERLVRQGVDVRAMERGRQLVAALRPFLGREHDRDADDDRAGRMPSPWATSAAHLPGTPPIVRTFGAIGLRESPYSARMRSRQSCTGLHEAPPASRGATCPGSGPLFFKR